jgi:hypothetical protein
MKILKVITIFFIYIFLYMVKIPTILVLCFKYTLCFIINTKAYVFSLFVNKPQLTAFMPKGFIYYKRGKIWTDKQEFWQKIYDDTFAAINYSLIENERTRTTK